MSRFCLLLVAVLQFGLVAPAYAYTENDIKRVNGYAAVLGRATACGIVLEKELVRVGAWIDARFGEEAQTYVEIFFSAMAENAQMQKSGKTTEGCKEIQSIINKIIWP